MTRRIRTSLPHWRSPLNKLRSNLHWLAILTVACGSTPPRTETPGSRGPHANEHLASARQHDEAARERATYPNTRVTDGTVERGANVRLIREVRIIGERK